MRSEKGSKPNNSQEHKQLLLSSPLEGDDKIKDEKFEQYPFCKNCKKMIKTL